MSSMKDYVSVTLKRVEISEESRIICISDIHGSLEIFKRLLEKVRFGGNDTLVLLGDVYTKGKKPFETIQYIVDLAEGNSNVHVLAGNCDWVENDFDEEDREWLKRRGYPSVILPEREAEFLRNLPHIIDAGRYIFAHAGLEDKPLEEQEIFPVVKNDNFVEECRTRFENWVIVGHMPTINLSHEYPTNNPLVFEDRHIIAIDGGNVVRRGGQINALIIKGGEFSFESEDDLPEYKVRSAQAGGGSYTVGWFERFAEVVSDNGEFSIVKIKSDGKEIEVPNDLIWTDSRGRTCVTDATDYKLAVGVGDKVKLIKRYSDRIMAKKDGVQGWIYE